MRYVIALLLLLALSAPAEARCRGGHCGITPTASVKARPGFMGWNRWKVAKRVQRGGFIARIRFSPG